MLRKGSCPSMLSKHKNRTMCSWSQDLLIPSFLSHIIQGQCLVKRRRGKRSRSLDIKHKATRPKRKRTQREPSRTLYKPECSQIFLKFQWSRYKLLCEFTGQQWLTGGCTKLIQELQFGRQGLWLQGQCNYDTFALRVNILLCYN